MSKIKEIHERLLKNPAEYTEIRLLIAKRTVAFFIMLYFTLFLFTIGGFSFGPVSLEMLSEITFHAYTILTIVVGWFLYEFSVYAVHVYLDDHRWVIVACLAVSVLFTGTSVALHIFL
jgi:sterol desaturase/sphingolipid hydroxylase (fatty acid hydroxylase superfamily)